MPINIHNFGSKNEKVAQQDAEYLESQNGTQIIIEISVLCIGLVGSGKTSTINSLLGNNKLIPASSSATKKIETFKIEAYGVKWTFIDTPGLYPAASAKACNEDRLRKIKAAISNYKPDVCLYFERMDYAPSENVDSGVFNLISEILDNLVFQDG